MALMTSIQLNTMEDLFRDQLQDLYDAEQRLANALPNMVDAATSPELKHAFEHHLQETENHVRRLERIFEMTGQSPESKTCVAMKGLISEGEEIIQAKGDSEVKDAALIGAAQRVEHYEMAGYGTARNLARRLRLEEGARLLQDTLDEEKSADQKLTSIAEEQVNPHAQP